MVELRGSSERLSPVSSEPSHQGFVSFLQSQNMLDLDAAKRSHLCIHVSQPSEQEPVPVQTTSTMCEVPSLMYYTHRHCVCFLSSLFLYASQMHGRSCFFRYDQRSEAWEPYDGLLGPSPVPWPILKILEPRCSVLPRVTSRYSSVPGPQNAVSFSISLEVQTSSNLSSLMLKLEATQNGIAVPIRAALLSTNVKPGPLQIQEFDVSAGFSLNPLPGAVDPVRVQKLEFQVDLSRALPGLIVINLWSSTDKPLVPMLLATGSALLLPKGLEQVSEELNHAAYACGEDLLADLADILAVNAPATKSSQLSRLNPSDTVLYKRQLLAAAKDILEWSWEAGLHHLECLVSDQIEILELPELMPIPLSAWWSGWWTLHGLVFFLAWNIYRGITGWLSSLLLLVSMRIRGHSWKIDLCRFIACAYVIAF